MTPSYREAKIAYRTLRGTDSHAYVTIVSGARPVDIAIGFNKHSDTQMLAAWLNGEWIEVSDFEGLSTDPVGVPLLPGEAPSRLFAQASGHEALVAHFDALIATALKPLDGLFNKVIDALHLDSLLARIDGALTRRKHRS